MYEILSRSALFDGFSPSQIAETLAGVEIRNFATGDVVALQGSRYDRLMILVEGSLTAETERHDKSGDSMTLERIEAPSIVAPSYLFAQHNALPATLVARTAASIMCIDRIRFTSMLSVDNILMLNFLRILSSFNGFVSEQVLYLTYRTIKSRLANYLLALSDRQQSLALVNTLTQREMAAMFGVTRPALARALGEMATEGTIFVNGKHITILFAEKLRQYARA